MATEIRHPAIAELTQDGDTFDLADYCRHCGRAIEPGYSDNETWVDSEIKTRFCYPPSSGDYTHHEPDTREVLS